MTAQKTERLLNLVICLLSTRQFLSKEQIRAAIPQYAESPSTEAFDRMFERDKDEVRDMGIPLETGSNSAWFEDEVGYRIDRAAYALPEVSFEPDELAVLGLASRVWQQASLAGPGRPGRCTSSRRPASSPTTRRLAGVEPRVRTSEPAFEPLYAAVRDRRPVTFPYRAGRAGELVERHLEPWGIVSWHGRWYVVGHDRDREARRVFRLSRIAGPVRAGRRAPATSQVPDGVDFRAEVAVLGRDQPAGRGDGLGPARLRACALRRRATAERRGRGAGGWDELDRAASPTRRCSRRRSLAYGPDVVVLGRRPRRRGASPAVRAGVRASRPPRPGGRRQRVLRRRGHDRRRRPSGCPGCWPWCPSCVTRQGIPLAEAAADFGITEAQLVKDLELLFVCGTPGHLPDDLIEAEWEGGHVYLRNADTIARPLRLGVDEALALVVGLRTLAEVPGPARPRRARPRPGQAGGGGRGRRRWPAPRSASRSRRGADVLAAARRGAGRGPAAAPDLLRADPRRDHRARRRPDAGRCSWTAAGTSRAGATAPRPSGCSGSTGSWASRCWTTAAAVPPEARRRDLDEGLFSPSPDDVLVDPRARPGGPLGRRLLPGRGGRGAARRAPPGAAARGRHALAAQLVLRLAGRARVLEPAELRSRR